MIIAVQTGRAVARPERYLLPAAQNVRPFQQGQLDGLCGLYAIINAVRLAAADPAALRKSDCQEIVRLALRARGKSKIVARTVCYGMSDEDLIGLLPLIFRMIKARGLFMRWRSAAVDDSIALDDHICRALLRGSAVVVSARHINHFTTICGYSPQQYLLSDSSNGRWFRRRPELLSMAVTVSRARGA